MENSRRRLLKRIRKSAVPHIIQGGGMDMGFEIVYTLGRELFPKGGPMAKSTRGKHNQSNWQTREKDGGYMISHEWL